MDTLTASGTVAPRAKRFEMRETGSRAARPTITVFFACRQSVAKLGWTLLVLLVLLNFAAVQAESAMEIHPHGHSGSSGANDHCCAGCHGGHFPVLHTASNVHLAVLSIAAWRAVIETAPPASGDGRTFNSSRAPPA